MNTLKPAFARVADQRQVGLRIHSDAADRAGVHTYRTAVAAIFIQPDPIFPAQRLMGAGGDALVVFAGQANTDGWNLRPVRFHMDSRPLGGAFAEVVPGADGHANLAFGAKRAF